MVTFLDFEKAANDEGVRYLNGRQFVPKLRQQIKDEGMMWEERRRNRSAATHRLFER